MKLSRIVACLSALVVAGFAAPAAAHAEAIPLGISSDSLDVAMSQDGSASVAYFTEAANPGGGDVTLHVCRIPAGGISCTETVSRLLPLDSVTGPWIVSNNNRVTAVAGSKDGATEGTWATTSANGQTTWSALTKVAPTTATDVELAPSGNRLYIASRYSPSANAPEDAAFSSGPVPGMGGPGDGNASVLLESSSPFSGDSQQVGIRPDGRPLTFVSGSGNEVYSYSYFGPAFDNAALNAGIYWTGRTDFSLGEPYTRNGPYEAATGYGNLWFGYKALSSEILVRKYTGTGFGTAVNPDCTNRRFGASAQDAPALAIGRTGLLHVAYTGSDGDNLHLGYFLGSADGSQFSPYQEIYTGPDAQRDVEIAADPTSDAGGIIVWTADDIYGGPLKFARIPAAIPGACPAPPAAGGGGAAAPSTPVTPTPVPKVKTTSSTSGGVKYDLETPNVCVPAGGKFVVSLKSTKVKKKNNVFVKITRVDFSATGAKTKKDTKAPFKQTLTVKKKAKAGSTITVKARAYIKLKKGKAPVKTVTSKIQVCA